MKTKMIKPSYETAADSAEGYLQKSIAFRKDQDFANSILTLREGMAHYPDSAALIHELAQRLRGQKNDQSDEEALHLFKKAIKIDPDKLEYKLDYADLLGKRGMTQEAEAILLPLYNPESPSRFPNSVVLPALARTYIKMERYDLAVACCGQCLEIRPDHALMKGVRKFLERGKFSYERDGWYDFLDYRREFIRNKYPVEIAHVLAPEIKREP